MAEEIIDLRDRIEQMRIQIENKAVEQISKEEPLEIHQQNSNSNISLSMENHKDYKNQNNNKQIKSIALTSKPKNDKFLSITVGICWNTSE